MVYYGNNFLKKGNIKVDMLFIILVLVFLINVLYVVLMELLFEGK